MVSDNYDVIIVGCGIAGALTGAILASSEHKRVLILERSSKIGGRAISFRAGGIRNASEFEKALGSSANGWCYNQRCEPELSQMLEKGLLDGYVLEAGGRAGWYTNRGRVSHALAAFNKPSIFYPTAGFVWFDHQWKPHNVSRGAPYGWMSEEAYAEQRRISGRMLRTPTLAAARQYDKVPLTDWLQQMTNNEEALEFHYAMGTFQTILNDPALISAGENLGAIIISREVGAHILHGAWSIAGDPGHRFIVEGFAAVVSDNGGQIINDARVKEISMQNGKVSGVVAEIGKETKQIEAPVVVCTAPPKQALQLLPENAVPSDFTTLLQRTINAGMITGQFGLAKPLDEFCRIEVDPRSFYHTPILVPESEGFRGNIPLDGVTLSNCAPTVAPEGKHLAVWASSALEEETRDRKKVDKVIDRMLEFLDAAFPGWQKAVEWKLFTVVGTALCWRHPEDDKPDVKCPSVEGLFFAGDAYGTHANEGGIEAASHSGLLCAGAITGKSYLDMVPPIFR